MVEVDPFFRERVAQEKRRWVRLTWVCNNQCRFCLDANVQTGAIRDLEELREEIREGIHDGCQRLILSGGEPTMHPSYLDLVAFGREVGYSWIQTVSNGRMFAYEGFAKKARAAGLSEATFSMHGHNARLHDHLVGVKGAFEQSMHGMENLIQEGVVVNLDVVINTLNVLVLPEVVDFFIKNGIGEFDLLWMVPFGRAWENRHELFPDPQKSLPFFREAIHRARKAGAVVWTNRLPPKLLEGFEDLIQNPHKLHDEVRGRWMEFAELLEKGQALRCREAERCAQCFMQGFCVEIERLVAVIAEGRLPALSVDLSKGRIPSANWVGKADLLRLIAEDIQDAADFVRELDRPPKRMVVELNRPPGGNPYRIGFEPKARLERVASADPYTLEALTACSEGKVEVILNKDTASWVAKRSAAIRQQTERFCFSLQQFMTLSELESAGANPVEALQPLSGCKVQLLNLPPCLLSGAVCVGEEVTIPHLVLLPTRHIDLVGFTEHFILERYRLFSARCDGCIGRQGCPGLPINYVRRFGFDIIRPLG